MFFHNIYSQSRTQSARSSWSRNEELWHNPFVFPTNPGDPVLLRMCKVFQDGGHANRNRHYILILGRKYEEYFVVFLSFLHNAIYSIKYIHSVGTLFKEIHVRLTINRLLTFKTILQQNYCENINQNNDQYSRSPIKRPLSCTIIISIYQSNAIMRWIMPELFVPRPRGSRALGTRLIYSIRRSCVRTRSFYDC